MRVFRGKAEKGEKEEGRDGKRRKKRKRSQWAKLNLRLKLTGDPVLLVRGRPIFQAVAICFLEKYNHQTQNYIDTEFAGPWRPPLAVT